MLDVFRTDVTALQNKNLALHFARPRTYFCYVTTRKYSKMLSQTFTATAGLIFRLRFTPTFVIPPPIDR